MLAKGFVGAILFKEYLKDDYYLELAKNNLVAANKLRDKLKKYLIYPNNTNQIFIKLKNEIVDKLNEYVEFEIWENLGDSKVVRLVTSYNTNNADIEEFFNVTKKVGL